MTLTPAKSYDSFVQGNFLSEAGEILDQLEITLGNARSAIVPYIDAVKQIESLALFTKNHAQQAGFHLVGMVAEKMAVFAHAAPNGDAHTLNLLEIYASTLCDLIEDYRQNRGVLVDEELLERLPSPGMLTALTGGDFTVAPGMDLLGLLAVPDKTTRNFLERELKNIGIKVAAASSFTDALRLAIATKPHFAVISAVLDSELSGVDVILALRALPRLQHMRLGLLSSFDRTSPELRDLPTDIPLIRKNHFSDDMAETLIHQHIL